MNPTFSIIVPVFNQGQYLAQALESVLSQTYKSYEILCVDDGSTDNSAQVASSYPVKIIKQVNKGLASARNTGIMNATGDFIYPIDADDMMLENCLEKVAEVIKNNPDVDIVAPSFKCFGISNEPIVLMPNPTLEDFKTGNRIPYFSAIRRTKLLEIGGYSPRMTFGWEDFHIWYNLLTRGAKLMTIPDILVLYRTKENSMIKEANKHSEELWSQIKKDFPQVFI